MYIGRGIMPQGLEIVAFQHRRCLRQYWTLAPRAAGIDVVFMQACPHRCLDLHPERRQVSVGEQTILLLEKGGNLMRNVATIKGLASGLQTSLPAARPGALLSRDESAHGACQVRLSKHLAWFREAPTGETMRHTTRPLPKDRQALTHIRVHEGVDRKAALGQGQSVLHDLG